MSNANKKPALSALPATSRLAEYHRQNPSPVWAGGKRMSVSEAAMLKAKAPAAVSFDGLSEQQIINRLTMARSGQSAPTNNQPADVAGEFVPGVGFVRYDDND